MGPARLLSVLLYLPRDLDRPSPMHPLDPLTLSGAKTVRETQQLRRLRRLLPAEGRACPSSARSLPWSTGRRFVENHRHNACLATLLKVTGVIPIFGHCHDLAFMLYLVQTCHDVVALLTSPPPRRRPRSAPIDEKDSKDIEPRSGMRRTQSARAGLAQQTRYHTPPVTIPVGRRQGGEDNQHPEQPLSADIDYDGLITGVLSGTKLVTLMKAYSRGKATSTTRRQIMRLILRPLAMDRLQRRVQGRVADLNTVFLTNVLACPVSRPACCCPGPTDCSFDVVEVLCKLARAKEHDSCRMLR